jgi:2-succinyl-5-enolpyruvyl-6-hydroxy-3-cyclohexene-1-carboxylate synthase
MGRNHQQNEKLHGIVMSIEGLENINRIWCRLIIDELIKQDIKSFYVSPGKRNLPIVDALTRSNGATIYNEMEERASSFKALGHIKATDKPAVLVCTSGTAMANYMPAVIEAARSALPLIIITADRPMPLVQSDANQSINQKNLFGEYAHQVNFDTASETTSPREIKSIVAHAINRTQQENKPVHINLPMKEPLDGTQDQTSELWRQVAFELIEDSRPFTIYKGRLDLEIEQILGHKNTLVVVGDLSHLPDKSGLKSFLKSRPCPIFADITSGLKVNDMGQLPSFDHQETQTWVKQQKLDKIVHIGGRVTSNAYYKFIQSNNVELIRVDQKIHHHDPSAATRTVYHINPNDLNSLKLEKSPLLVPPLTWPQETSKPNIFTLASTLNKHLKGFQLFLGNSTSIRAFDMLQAAPACPIFFQRGVSGIEGHISTTLGLFQGNQIPTVSVIGDVSFIHDLASLIPICPSKDDNITIIVANNGQGGIFNLLNLVKSEKAVDYITTKHNIRFKELLNGLPINTSSYKDLEQLDQDLPSLLKSGGIKIVEVLIDDRDNQETYKQATGK